VTADVDRSPPGSADLRALSRDRLTWAVVAGLLVLTGLVSVLIDDRPSLPDRVAFTIIPVAVLAAALVFALRRGATLAAGALAIAVTPAVLAAVAAAVRWGAVGVLAASVAVVVAQRDRAERAVAATVAAVFTIIGVVAWAASTPDRLTRLTWGQVTKRTGQLLMTSVGSLDATLVVPATAWLLWWIAAGLVAGASLVAGSIRVAAMIPLATAVMVAAGWAIMRWRGDVDMSGGGWIVVGALAYAGAAVRLDPATARRIGIVLLVIAAYIWTVTIVHLARN
jgi:hypothetical protein